MKPAGTLRPKEIIRYCTQQRPSARRDRVTTEEPLEIRLITGPQGQSQKRSLVLTMRTPGQDYELAAGLLYSEGLIQRKDDIVKMSYCLDVEEQDYNILQVRLHPRLEPEFEQSERYSLSNASCGLCGKRQISQLQTQIYPDFGPHSPPLRPEALYPLQAQLRPQQKVFQKTGSIHAAALLQSNGEILSVCEDVGRHNAVDKVIGQALLQDRLPLLDKMLWVSGRSSFEIIQKALQASIPIVLAVGAPSSLAVELAEAYGQTLIGFLKSDSFNVYAGAERILEAEN